MQVILFFNNYNLKKKFTKTFIVFEYKYNNKNQ